jgi:tetratricopeptide (TPR) repeat protein
MPIRLGMMALVVLLLARGWAGAADGVTDAKRRAAAELIKQGKNADAVALLHEVVKADPDNYRDHLALARAYDKLNKSPEAVAEYHRVLELLSGNEDRAARLEADRRLKVLDALGIKILAAVEEFLKKLDTLEREAIGARDMRAVEQVFRLKAGVWSAQRRKDAMGFEVHATEAWQAAPITLERGRRYRVRAAGTWTVNGGLTCSGDGVANRPSGGAGTYGSLLAKLDNGTEVYAIGTGGTITATNTGKLQFISAMPTHAERLKNSGSLYVLIERE